MTKELTHAELAQAVLAGDAEAIAKYDAATLAYNARMEELGLFDNMHVLPSAQLRAVKYIQDKLLEDLAKENPHD